MQNTEGGVSEKNREAEKMAELAKSICSALRRGATVRAAKIVLSIPDTEFDRVMAFTRLLMEARGGRES